MNNDEEGAEGAEDGEDGADGEDGEDARTDGHQNLNIPFDKRPNGTLYPKVESDHSEFTSFAAHHCFDFHYFPLSIFPIYGVRFPTDIEFDIVRR